MAGYYGYSMSNNAVSAYADGEKPLSKWSKVDILSEIQGMDLKLNCDLGKLKKMPAKALKEVCLYQSSWHHTSNHFNQTNFYSIDVDRIEMLTNDEIDNIISGTQKEVIAKPLEEKWKCAFLEWSGSRKHPKATECTEIGIVNGDWFYRADGSKKKTSAKGFRFIEKIQ